MFKADRCESPEQEADSAGAGIPLDQASYAEPSSIPAARPYVSGCRRKARLAYCLDLSQACRPCQGDLRGGFLAPGLTRLR